MSWIFNTILPSCCTRREANRQANECVSPTKSDEQNDIIKLDIISESNFKDSSDDLYRHSKSFDEPRECDQEEKIQSEFLKNWEIETPETADKLTRQSSITSISSIDNACHVLEQFKCVECNQAAQGFCFGCRNLRYCRSCYEKAHKGEQENHRFCAYAKKKFTSTSNALRALAMLSYKKN
ncbi:unnamed protein product [Blepharisma stoltei]|uniref:Uncharacterized protein n=1 Tax=Blepharisma stoltei TaxID=1481888 RepID=A0AAU9IJ92_9CILI|nr:unnamed protein product [Blepharisma stoltei]